MRHTLTTLTLALVALLAARGAVPAQTAPRQQARRDPGCDRQRALSLVRQQAEDAWRIEHPVRRIAVMVRAAALLWPHEQKTARKVFAEAFDLASRDFREKGDETKREGVGLFSKLPDQRFVVIRAVARLDAEWGRSLAAQAADDTRKAAEGAGPKVAVKEVGDKLVLLALSLVTDDQATAVGLVRSSYRHPTSYALPAFLYKLHEADPAAAAGLYREALAAYAGGTVEDLIYLSLYPFALTRPMARVRASMGYSLPPNFGGAVELQRPYLEVFLKRAEEVLAAQTGPVDPRAPVSDPQRILTSLAILEPVIAERFPAYSAKAALLKAAASGLLPERVQRRADSESESYWRVKGEPEAGAFERSVEQAGKHTNPAIRDQFLTQAVWAAAEREELKDLEAAAEKIGDPGTRRQLLDAVYFARAQKLIRGGQADEAARLIEKVDALDQRALLSLEAADAALKRPGDEPRARESLDAAAAVTAKAPETNEKARALLGVASLYAKFDPVRAFEVLSAAVKTINEVADPSLDEAVLRRRIEGKNFGFYMGAPAPAFTLESAFGAMGALDFEQTLSWARNLQDGGLRAQAILSLAAPCMKDEGKAKEREKTPPDKKGAPAPRNTVPQRKAAVKGEK